MDKTLSFTHENTSGEGHSSSIDLTMNDYEDDSATASDVGSHYLRKAVKRRLSISLTDSVMKFADDTLHSTRSRPSWSFGRISKLNISPRQKSLTPSLSHSDIMAILPSHKRLRNEFASGNKHAVTGASIRNLGSSRASSLHQADTEDVQMLDGKPSNSNSPAQILRPNSISTTPHRSSTRNLSAGNNMPLFSGTGTSEDKWGGIKIDRLYPLRKSGSEQGQTTIPSGVEVIDLEATGNAIQDDYRFDRFESDYLTEAEFEIFLQRERRRSGQDLDSDVSEVIEVNDAKLITNLKRINLQGRAESTASEVFPLAQVQHRNHTYKAGKCVELDDGGFLRIKSIHKDTSGEIWLVGDLLLRTNSQGPRMPKRRNELVWIIMTNDLTDDSKSSTTMNLNSVKRIRKVRFTNQRYEKLNTTKHENALKNKYDDVDFGESFCRIRRTQIISDNGRKVIEESIELVEESEADAGDRIDASKLRDDWRGVKTILGGSSSQTVQSIALEEGVGSELFRIQNYSYGDAFCGAGGTSRGAVMAGLKVKWAFDCDHDAVVTYKANFDSTGTQCYKEEVAEFLDRITRLPIHQQQEFTVDILHISPPCKPFSSAHTRQNEENDAKNQAALCSVLHLIQVIKPRVVTIEETEGLLSRHDEWFSTLIHIFVYVGYSVRWKALRCEEYGVPQTRRRLFLIASAPGEKLPQIAKPTHGVGGADLVTIRDSISNIHHAATAQKQFPTTRGFWPKPSYSARTLCRTLTCGGGPPHPSGRRNFTLRELASLQTFPWFHLFPVSGITMGRIQVGNAVPPLMAKTLYEQIIRTLQETDGVGGRE